MDPVVTQIAFKNWNRKIIALVTAVIIWVFVNQSITETKTIANVPIKVVNLPTDKTIVGLLPNGYTSQRATLTLKGSKDVIHVLEQGDLEVHLDATTADSDDWVVQITKKNLVSLNPSLDLSHHIQNVSHPEFVIKLSKLITEKIPIIIRDPIGSAPEGYEFLDIWPRQLMQTISGPKEEIQNLKVKGLRLTFDLSKITQEELDSSSHTKKHGHDDEVSYFIPDKWKRVPIPFRHDAMQEINDPEAQNLRIDFLKKSLLPIGKEIPVSVYYPLKYLDKMNPETHTLAPSESVHFKEGVPLFSLPLYVKDVSRLFLDIIRDRLAIVVIAAPKEEREFLRWSVEIIDPHELEDTYVAFELADQRDSGIHLSDSKKRDDILRKRFKDYLEKLELYTADGLKLELSSFLHDGNIQIEIE